MLNEYFNFKVNNDNYSVDDWNELIRNTFKQYFLDESVFEQNKEILRTEFVNYCLISESGEYLKLFKNSIKFYNQLRAKSNSDFCLLFAEHFNNLCGSDMKWTNYVLTQTDFSKYTKRDQIIYKFKVIEDILEGCFKSRFKLLYNVEVLNKNVNYPYVDNLDFGKYVSNFVDSDNKFNLYIYDPIIKLKISQWRNIATHKTYEVEKEHIKLIYGKGRIKEVEISYNDFEKILKWVKLTYYSLRLSQVITYLSNPKIYKLINQKNIKIDLRFEQWILHIIHNLQIVGFQFIKINDNDQTFSIYSGLKI